MNKIEKCDLQNCTLHISTALICRRVMFDFIFLNNSAQNVHTLVYEPSFLRSNQLNDITTSFRLQWTYYHIQLLFFSLPLLPLRCVQNVFEYMKMDIGVRVSKISVQFRSFVRFCFEFFFFRKSMFLISRNDRFIKINFFLCSPCHFLIISLKFQHH